MDEGPPSSYLLLARDTPVFGADGAVAGTVGKIISEPDIDIFDGLVLTTRDGDRYLEAELVTAIHERGVDISLPAARVGALPRPMPHRHVKYDLAADERPWSEILHWLSAHLARLLHGTDEPLDAARERLERRDQALRLAREDPRLALEAGVGRPDLPAAFDGGLVDVNNAPAAIIAGLPTFDGNLAARIIAAREQIDGFSSLEDLGSVLDLPGDQVEHLRDRVVFLPR
jgi:hypothetical protein